MVLYGRRIVDNKIIHLYHIQETENVNSVYTLTNNPRATPTKNADPFPASALFAFKVESF